jgi:dolichol-phosphate mannosyltransferase
VLAVGLIGALQLLCLGLLGEYVARLFQASQKRPQFMIGYDTLEDPGHHSYAQAVEGQEPDQR